MGLDTHTTEQEEEEEKDTLQILKRPKTSPKFQMF
jgi:hypothetical protein